MVLETLPAEKLIATLEWEHWTGRKGYSVRGMWSALIAGLLHQCRSLAEVVRLLKKLVRHEQLLEECFTDLVERLCQLLPGFGDKLSVDSTDIKAYAKGHRSNPADPDARWGAKRADNKGSGVKAKGAEDGECRKKGGI